MAQGLQVTQLFLIVAQLPGHHHLDLQGLLVLLQLHAFAPTAAHPLLLVGGGVDLLPTPRPRRVRVPALPNRLGFDYRFRRPTRPWRRRMAMRILIGGGQVDNNGLGLPFNQPLFLLVIALVGHLRQVFYELIERVLLEELGRFMVNKFLFFVFLPLIALVPQGDRVLELLR